MYAEWNDVMLPIFLSEEEWKFCREVFDKGEKGTASKDEIENVNSLLKKNTKGYQNNISKEQFDELEKKVIEDMKNNGELPKDFK